MKFYNWSKMKVSTFLTFFSSLVFFLPENALAFPIYAQQAYENPREANGRIVCANCHLAQKPTEIETPQAVLPNSVFEAEVKIPYDLNSKQVLGSGAKGGLNVGADAYRQKTKALIKKYDEIKQKNKGVYISAYSAKAENILVVGPISGDKHQEITFPVLAPDPATNSEVFFLKYPIYVGANRGRGQVNPTGDKTNNNAIISTVAGQVSDITTLDKGITAVTIKTAAGADVIYNVPKGLELAVSKGNYVKVDTLISKDPNVGGFGQSETEITLQSPARIYGYMLVTLFIILTQIFLVIKKKQFEKVQAAEMNF